MSKITLGITDRSGTITAGGSANAVTSVKNTGRNFLLIQNLDAAEDLWVRLDGTAAAVNAAGSLVVPARAALVFEDNFCPSGPISVIAATTGHKFTIWEG